MGAYYQSYAIQPKRKFRKVMKTFINHLESSLKEEIADPRFEVLKFDGTCVTIGKSDVIGQFLTTDRSEIKVKLTCQRKRKRMEISAPVPKSFPTRCEEADSAFQYPDSDL